jgi:hypothetical protein
MEFGPNQLIRWHCDPKLVEAVLFPERTVAFAFPFAFDTGHEVLSFHSDICVMGMFSSSLLITFTSRSWKISLVDNIFSKKYA